MQSISFNPKARLIKILGEQLIKDASVGLVELVKNSYDADATKVSIQMHAINTGNAKIVIQDNGRGMDLDTFTQKWMNPAVGHKEIQKNRVERTLLGRLPLGEKGVGRFAAQQIGEYLQISSKVLGSSEQLLVKVDWAKFDEIDADLSDISVQYEMRPVSQFDVGSSGTRLEISGLKSKWLEKDIAQLSNTLLRMKSPFKGANDFDVILDFIDCSDDLTKYSNLETTDILDKAHYKFYALINDNGDVDYEYEFNVKGYQHERKTGVANVVRDTGKEFRNKVFNRDLSVGDFSVTFHVYSKLNEILKITGVEKHKIEDWCGVNVYRDGIRILPYGEKGNDWLDLGYRRIQQPGKVLSNDQVIGLIEINQEQNANLRDKTNREGLIEDEHYQKFSDLILGSIIILESLMYDDRQKIKRKKEVIGGDFIQAKVVSIKDDIAELKGKLESPDGWASNVTNPLLMKVDSQVSELEIQFSEAISELEKDKQLLFNLAGTGLAAERFTHEFARLVGGALSALDRLKKRLDLSDGRVKKEVDSISVALEALRNDIRLLGPMFYIKKVAKERVLDISDVIKNTIALHQSFLLNEKIEVEVIGDTFDVIMREGSCMQVFSNLIDNAIFWCSRKSELDNRKIKIQMCSSDKIVFVSDSGPGVSSRIRDKIFDPFFSMKGEEGRGLGLYIVKEILDEKNFQIELIQPEDGMDLLSGAAFRLDFNNKLEIK